MASEAPEKGVEMRQRSEGDEYDSSEAFALRRRPVLDICDYLQSIYGAPETAAAKDDSRSGAHASFRNGASVSFAILEDLRAHAS
eukprot:scaffold7055_cov254-Pinguiococcus_pyrenoidosus.AAC.2